MTNTSATYLITGGTGTLGTALTHTLLAQGHKVRTLSRSEHSITRLEESVAVADRPRLSAMCGDVRSPSRLRLALRGVDYVIHAAALKGVSRCEYDPGEAVLTNVQGTINVALACVEEGVKRAVFVSSDKACSPHNLYGMTKAVGERVWLASNRYSAGQSPEFVAVRYGNCWGSNGSVIHRWRASTGPIVLTDPECTRFHLRVPDAVEFVLSALRSGETGSLYVPVLASYRLRDLATAFDASKRPEVIGLQPGEKLHETMVNEHEARHALRDKLGGMEVIRIDPSIRGRAGDGVVEQGVGVMREYTSGGNTWRMTVDELRAEIKALLP